MAREADPDFVLHRQTITAAFLLPLTLAALLPGCQGCGQGDTPSPAGFEVASPDSVAPTTLGRVEGAIRAPKGIRDQPLPPETADGCAPGGSPSGSILIGDGAGLGDAAVMLHRGPRSVGEKKRPLRRHEAMDRVLTLRGCALDQRTLVARVGDRLVMHNEDERFHTVGLSELDGGAERRSQTVPLAPKEREVSLALTQPGFYRLSSDQLPWLRGLLLVLRSHEEGVVTGMDGNFAIDGLETGSWNASIRHEVLGETKSTVEVVAGETAALYEEFEGAPGSSE